MLNRAGWRYLSSRPLRRVAPSALAASADDPQWSLFSRRCAPLLGVYWVGFGRAPTNSIPCALFRRCDRHASSSSSPSPQRGMRETSPLKDSPELSSTESSRLTDTTDEELGENPAELAPTENLSWKERAKNFAVEYGRVGIATHLVLSVVSISVIYVVVSSGVDVSGLLHALGLSTDNAGKDAAASSAGSFIITYAIYKVAAPVRWPLTFAVTPVVMRALRSRGYMLPKTKSNAHRSPRSDAEETSRSDQRGGPSQ